MLVRLDSMLNDSVNPNAVKVLILQHPSEARNPLSTVGLVAESIPGCVRKVGLSWRSFKQALGSEANPREWAVLFVGTKKNSEKWAKMPFAITSPKDMLLKKGIIKGIVLLDGNWAQSKTLWWRNAWLLKLNRMVLNATPQSRYNEIRKEPRKNCLSTAEAAAEVLKHLGDTEAASKINSAFTIFVDRILAGDIPALIKPPVAQKFDEEPEQTSL